MTTPVTNLSPGRFAHASSHRRRAFTLIELLTVIAIIGILAAILIPVVGKVRKSAAATKCSSNLRGFGTALSLYANDHKNTLPSPAGANNSFYDSIHRLVPLMTPYVVGHDRTKYNWGTVPPHAVEAWRCPGDDPSDANGFDGAYHGSSYNYQWQYRGQRITDPMVSRDPSWEWALQPVPLSQAPIMWDFVKTHHDGREAFLFLDGHVALQPLGWSQPYAHR